VTRPIVFCTDYGTADEFVGVCHGVIASIAPDAKVLDLTHAIPRQDVTRGALVLSRAVAYMPADAVYCAVVDPGVGSERRAIAVRAASGALLVGPDNGVLSAAWQELGGAVAAHAIESPAVTLAEISNTFHGRDVFAPCAAHLARGVELAEVGPALQVEDLRTFGLPGPMVAPLAVGARVSAIDGFGNVQLNALREHLDAAGIGDRIVVAGHVLPIVGIFADLPQRGLGAIVDSQGFLALVVNQGSAAEVLGLSDGAAVVLEAPPDERHLQPVD
jgi:S-adenosyl-L-methionine hydrolase (adenosine-forming)